ncbi:MAG: hypothetical protein AAF492_32960, partial [Verrucomicrobiota bacterium]
MSDYQQNGVSRSVWPWNQPKVVPKPPTFMDRLTAKEFIIEIIITGLLAYFLVYLFVFKHHEHATMAR